MQLPAGPGSYEGWGLMPCIKGVVRAAYLQRTGREGPGPVWGDLQTFQVTSQTFRLLCQVLDFQMVATSSTFSKPRPGQRRPCFAQAASLGLLPPKRCLLPFLLITRASSRVWDSRLALMNITTWSWVCSEMSRPLINTI